MDRVEGVTDQLAVTINGVPLTEQQRADFLAGKTIVLTQAQTDAANAAAKPLYVETW